MNQILLVFKRRKQTFTFIAKISSSQFQLITYNRQLCMAITELHTLAFQTNGTSSSWQTSTTATYSVYNLLK